jgi:osmotically-inducible protein OsmY
VNRTALIVVAAAGLGLVACDDRTPNTAPRGSATGTVRQPDPSKAPDNTDRNVRDRDNQNLTPLDQSGTEADRKITAAVRRSITDDSTMSVNARNCKIITQNGTVTLRGTVDTQGEKDAIEAKAKSVEGVMSVDNQLEVKGG